ncbi:MAG TPA: S-layer protein domain-containing protein, partial [Methanotrichaceae archaeon]|nr:S-layer protein domain-containing protein [Methanotrichaceae archaeon]
MPGFGLKTADSNAVRYYIYKSIDNPGIYEVRGSAATGDFTWNAQNFQGFYYDPDKDIGTEVLSAGLTEGISLSGDSPYGLTYRTMAQAKSFKFSDWGQYNIIGFLGKGYFAGYAQESDSDPSQQILRINSKSPNLLNTDGLSEILFDDNREQTVPKGSSLKLKQGYELLIKSVNQDGQAYLELLKDGKAIDSKILAPSAEGATMADKTYWYAKAFGSSNIVTLAVHLKNVYRDEDVAAATVDGIWQISDQFMPIKVGSQYGLMNVASYSADSLTMDNKDHAIRLSRNKDISIMPGLNIRVADNDTLKYYPYTTVTVNESTVKSAPEGTGLQNEAPGIMPEAEKTSYSEGSQDNLTAANEDKGITTGKQRENTSKAIDPGI